jgi:hypothetical protein
MFDEKIIKLIENTLNTLDDSHVSNYDKAKEIAKALWKSRLLVKSPEMMDEQELNIYKWTAMENDGYTHMESGVANNMFDAFIKATEHSPDYHKYIEIKKVPKEEYTESQKELLNWYTEKQ